MTSDEMEDRFYRNIEAWENVPLKVFRIADWDGTWRWSSRHDTLHDIATSIGVRHVRESDDRRSGIDVTSHRPDDAQQLRVWVMTNMAIQVVMDRTRGQQLGPQLHNRRIQRLKNRLLNGQTPWTAVTVLLDGTEHSAERVICDEHWAVFAYLLDEHLTIVGTHLPVRDLRLITIDEPAPSIAEGSYGSTGQLMTQIVTLKNRSDSDEDSS